MVFSCWILEISTMTLYDVLKTTKTGNYCIKMEAETELFQKRRGHYGAFKTSQCLADHPIGEKLRPPGRLGQPIKKSGSFGYRQSGNLRPVKYAGDTEVLGLLPGFYVGSGDNPPEVL